MAEEDRDFLRFLWLKRIDQKDFELVVNRFTPVMFCLTCSPSLLSMTVRHHIFKYLDLNEDLVINFSNDLCMDDSISGSDSSEKYLEFYLRMKPYLKEGNFNLRKWISNCAEIMEKINSFEEQEFDEKTVHLDKFHKVLGILWNFEIDELFFDLKNVVSESQISIKREFLKVLSSVYDPLGVVSPTIITLKMFQKICMMKINWDDIAEWQNIFENVNVTNSLKLERHHLKMFDLKDVEIIEPHGFSDASLKTYVAVIFILDLN